MLTLLLSLLGVGGVGGIAAFFYPQTAVTLFSGVKRWASRVPPKVWLYLGIAAAIFGALVWHVIHEHLAVKAQVAAAYAQGRNDYAVKVEKQARAIEAKANAVTGAINQTIRDRHNEELGHIHATGDALRLSGPGAALCGSAALPAASGGHQPAGGTGDAAVDRLPYPEWSQLIAMPFDDATRFAEQNDAYRDEVKSWHEWWPKMNAAWEKLRAQVKGE